MNDDNIEVWNDPELEARILAMIMGEASDFERAELEREIAKDPALQRFQEEMQSLTEFGGLAHQPDDDPEWKLAPERREKLLDTFRCDDGDSQEPVVPTQASIKTSHYQWRNAISMAACLMLTLLVMAVMFPDIAPIHRTRVFKQEAEIICYAPAPEILTKNFEERSVVFPQASPTPVGGLSKDSSLLAKKKQLAPKPARLRGAQFAREGKKGNVIIDRKENLLRPMISSQVARKPSAPSSQMAKVIGSSTASPTSIPLPEIAVIEPSLDFASGDNFGDGWGDGDGAGAGEGDKLSYGKYRSRSLADEIPRIEGRLSKLSPAKSRRNSERFKNDSADRKREYAYGSQKALYIKGLEKREEVSNAALRPLLGAEYAIQDTAKSASGGRDGDGIVTFKEFNYRDSVEQKKSGRQSKAFSLNDKEITEEEVDPFAEDIDFEGKKINAPADRPDKPAAPAEPQKPAPVIIEEMDAADLTHSTFSLNVNDVSFKLAQAALLERGEWPSPESIRTEEFVNAFDYGDPRPSMQQKVACAIEQAAHPFIQQRNLLRLSMSTAAQGRSAPLDLTVLLDNSGSMEREDREQSVLKAMELLADQLGPNDRITVMSFARKTRLLADRVNGQQAGNLVDLVARTPSEGGTNLEQAVLTANQHALRHQRKGAQSRIVVMTDGAANLGNANPESLSKMIASMRDQGIAFDACGIGAEGLDDGILEALTRKGDGRYYLINRPEDADAGFAKQLAGALNPAAKNVKVQVVFNPDRVGNYRLLGFEKHRLNKEDFRNDKVDAAEMAAEESGSALYQVEAKPDGQGAIGTVFVRFQDSASGEMVERSWTIPYQADTPTLTEANKSMQLAATAGLLAEKLHGTDAGSVNFNRYNEVLGKLHSSYPNNQRVQQLIQMCQQANDDL